MFRPLFLLLLAPTALAINCTTSFFQAIVPSNASVAFATPVSANSTFIVPTRDIAYPINPTNLQALCAVEIKISSSSTSAYSFGLFLPDAWNSRFLAVGNGGFAGGVNWLDMGAGVGYGFAVMSTDTGHSSNSSDGRWALDNAESVTDWGYRAMHGSVEVAKSVVQAYYGSAASYNYYSGCSTGGRQGIKELQMFPDDFDGVLAGAPAWWTSHLQPWTVRLGLYNLPTTAEHHIPPALFPIVEREVLRQCDGQDGLVDSIISDPRGCNFYPEAVLCGSNTTNQTESGCLTAPQIGTLYKIYNDYVETNQTFVFPHLNLGSESQWKTLLGSDAPHGLGTGYIQYFVLNDPTWSFYDFNYSLVQLADQIQPGNATAGEFDMSAFHAKGGKLLSYHGMADGLIPTGSTEFFYRQVVKTLVPEGADLDSWYRLFLVPGMQHCAGTSTEVNAPWYFAGANQAADLNAGVHGVPGFDDSQHDALLALVDWTENGVAPEKIIATKWRNDTLQDKVLRQRPLCPYPRFARYAGDGNPNEAQNWECVSQRGLTIQYD